MHASRLSVFVALLFCGCQQQQAQLPVEPQPRQDVQSLPPGYGPRVKFPDNARNAAVSFDGKYVAAASGYEVIVHENGLEVGRIKTNTTLPKCVFSPKGRHLVITTPHREVDSQVILWDIDTRKEELRLQDIKKDGFRIRAEVSPGENCFVVAGIDPQSFTVYSTWGDGAKIRTVKTDKLIHDSYFYFSREEGVTEYSYFVDYDRGHTEQFDAYEGRRCRDLIFAFELDPDHPQMIHQASLKAKKKGDKTQ